jgi:DNA-binding response OmpR family regulator
LSQSNFSILVVEDEINIRNQIVEYLRFDYDNIYEASTQDEAFKIYQLKRPSLIIVDINLTQGSGLSLLREIRESDHSIKAIVISAYSDKEYLLAAIDLKLSKYIIKPITRRGFKEALDSVKYELDKFETINKKIMHLSSEHSWNFETSELFYKNSKVELSYQESRLLELFCNNINSILSYSDIEYYLWEYSDRDKKNSIKLIVKNLRKNLPENSITNIYGVGYKLIVNFIYN